MNSVPKLRTPSRPKETKTLIARMLKQIDELHLRMKAEDSVIAQLVTETEQMEVEGGIMPEETKTTPARAGAYRQPRANE